MIYEFGGCVLDTATAELFREGDPVAVEPQVLAVIEHLVANPDRVVTKMELLDEVWGDRFVSESALTSRIKLARRACGDTGREQRVIKTVHGRGYRLVAPVTPRGTPAAVPTPTARPGPGTAGREREMDDLVGALARAAAGEQTVVVVTGAAGAGKSAVVADFLERSDDLDRWLVLRGQCVSPRSGPEPYFALLQALGALAEVEPDLTRDALDRVAPSWLVQLPTLVDNEAAAHLERRLLGGARHRMLREGADALTELARRRPTLLVLEDLHLADDFTLDVLELLAGRRDPVPLLVVATARPGASTVDPLVSDLSAARTATVVDLGPLDGDALGQLIQDRHPGRRIDPELVAQVCGRCDGNPLFALEILTECAASGLITDDGASLVLTRDDDLAGVIPASLVPLIERTFERLGVEERSVLEAAAAAGVTFDAASVAAGLDQGLDPTEATLARIARSPDHISATGSSRWPDGTVSTSFAFTHQLYRDVVLDRIPPGRTAELHRRIGLALEAAHEGALDPVTVALADHFVAAGDTARSARYLRRAGVQANARQAHQHALDLFDAALEAGERLDPGPERDAAELAIRLSRGEARVAVAGWFDQAVLADYGRALELATATGAVDEEASARYALATISEMHGDFERTETLLSPIVAAGPTNLAMEAHELIACSTFHQGALERSELNSEAVLSTWAEDTDSKAMAQVAEHPATSCNSWLALSNWLLGRSDESLRRAENAIRLGERHPYALATATQQRAMLHQLRREPEACRDWAERTVDLPPGLAPRVRRIQAELFVGWARAVSGPGDDDLTAMADALGRFTDAGVELNAPYYRALYAEALLQHDRAAEALELLDEVDAEIDAGSVRTYFYRSEIHRLRAQALLRRGDPDSVEGARDALDESLRLTGEMGSPALALRTTADRFELERGHGDADVWRERLSELVVRYDGQEPPPDVVRGRALLHA